MVGSPSPSWFSSNYFSSWNSVVLDKIIAHEFIHIKHIQTQAHTHRCTHTAHTHTHIPADSITYTRLSKLLLQSILQNAMLISFKICIITLMLARISAHCWVDTLYLHIVGFLSSMVWGGIYVLSHSCTWLFHLFLMDWDLFQRPSKSFPIFTFVSYFWFIIKSEKSVQQPKEHEVLFGHRRAPVRPRHLATALDSCSKPVCFHSLSRALGCWLCFCLVFGERVLEGVGELYRDWRRKVCQALVPQS